MNRRFVVRLKKKDQDPKKAVWQVVWGRRSKDLDSKMIWVEDTTDDVTLADLEGQIESLKERGKVIQSIIVEIKKAGNHGQNNQ
jgi:hypothetical protein